MYHATHTTISVKIKVPSKTSEYSGRVVKQDWCEAILEQMWGSTSLGRGGAFSDLKEQFRSGRISDIQWG